MTALKTESVEIDGWRVSVQDDKPWAETTDEEHASWIDDGRLWLGWQQRAADGLPLSVVRALLARHDGVSSVVSLPRKERMTPWERLLCWKNEHEGRGYAVMPRAKDYIYYCTLGSYVVTENLEATGSTQDEAITAALDAAGAP